MDKLRETYQELMRKRGKESLAPLVMELSEEEDRVILEDHLGKEFTPVGKRPSLTLDEFLEFEKTTEGLECHTLIRGYDGRTALYFEVKKVNQELIQETLRRMGYGDEIHIHVKGEDQKILARKLEAFLKPKEIEIENIREVVEGEYGQVYKIDDIYYIKAKIENKLGLHARPTAEFVQKVKSYKSEIRVINPKTQQEVPGESIMGMLILAATQGTDLIIEAKGQGAPLALKGLYATIKGFIKEDKEEGSNQRDYSKKQ